MGWEADVSEIDPGVVATQVADEMSAPDPTREVGRRRLRKEDARLVTGQTQWTDNITFAGMLHRRCSVRESSRPSAARTSPTNKGRCRVLGR